MWSVSQPALPLVLLGLLMKFQAQPLFHLANEQEFGDFFFFFFVGTLLTKCSWCCFTGPKSMNQTQLGDDRGDLYEDPYSTKNAGWKCQRCTCNKVDTIFMCLAN